MIQYRIFKDIQCTQLNITEDNSPNLLYDHNYDSEETELGSE
jgi:hypothetical protein